MTRDDFGHKAAEIAQSLSLDLQTLMLKAFDTLTEDERAKLADDSKPYLIVRAIGMAVGQRSLEDRFDVQAIKALTPKVKRLLNRRGF